MTNQDLIKDGKASLGIEFGSTRIKAVLIHPQTCEVLASGSHSWENRLENGIWTYHLDEVVKGMQSCYQDLVKDIQDKYQVKVTKFAAIGISAMMHGYIALDKDDKQLSPFKTWRNTCSRDASAKLTEIFQFNIPERWTIAHLYQSILNDEEHVKDLDYVITLAGYIHYLLTGQKVLGVGDAAGMFPIDSDSMDFAGKYVDIFDKLIENKHYSWKLKDIFPKVLKSGQSAGNLTESGAKLLDPTGSLEANIPLCPPEGDAGTGMVATNAVAPRTGNVSAGTSIFAMIVLEHALKDLHRELDNVCTPDGRQVAMVHANNCTSDLNAWVSIFDEFAKLSGHPLDPNNLFKLLYNHALTGEENCGGVLTYGYLSGEFITNLTEGRPMMVRTPDSKFTLANLMRSNLNTSLGAVRLGMDILASENVKIDKLLGHGGLFKTKGVGQKIMADALNIPVWVMTTAGEGGAWGIAILANYLVNKACDQELPDYLDKVVFKEASGDVIKPDPKGVHGFNEFMQNYVKCLPVEKAATECFK